LALNREIRWTFEDETRLICSAFIGYSHQEFTGRDAVPDRIGRSAIDHGDARREKTSAGRNAFHDRSRRATASEHRIKEVCQSSVGARAFDELVGRTVEQAWLDVTIHSDEELARGYCIALKVNCCAIDDGCTDCEEASAGRNAADDCPGRTITAERWIGKIDYRAVRRRTFRDNVCWTIERARFQVAINRNEKLAGGYDVPR